jgi:L,D-peptidoglycan transpeptidase YkuD (ErfK/YbiS/YcfS/YnhG family)
MSGKQQLERIIVAPVGNDKTRGRLVSGGSWAPCALGRSGITRRKREGDGATPAGSHSFVEVYYRPDRVRRPATNLPTYPLNPRSAWCDDPCHRRYNRAVRLPFAGSHERLWRSDHLYDLMVVLDYNLGRPRRGTGSAIFLHLATTDFSPTLGCVAVTLPTLRQILYRSGPGTFLDIG